MNQNNKRNRSGTGAGGGNQQQRRRRRPTQGGQGQPQVPNGPAMTALGESTYEAVFDHGNQGYGVWFDGMVREDPTYRQFWKGTGTRPLYVRILEDRIVLTKEIDREGLGLLEPVRRGAESDDAGADADRAAGDDQSQGSGGADADIGDAFTPEEAARLFVQAGDEPDEPAPSTALDAVPTEDTPVEAASGAAEGADADEAPAPRPKRRTPRRRKVVTDDAPAADAGDDS